MGSKSIKKVLPVLVPELSYDELNVHEGQSAQRLWMEVVLEGKYADKREQHLADLLEYCALDTLAMVKIYERLADLSPAELTLTTNPTTTTKLETASTPTVTPPPVTQPPKPASEKLVQGTLF